MNLALKGSECALAVTLALAPTLAAAWEKDKTYNITILHTNDPPGHFWQNANGEYGLAAQKTLVDQIRHEVAAQGGSVLLLSGGDINTGVPESDLQDAEPDFRGMNLVGYDAMAIGNHEFETHCRSCASRKNGPRSRYFPPIFISKVRKSVCLSRMKFSISKRSKLR